ncbi:serine/threonine-protein kinase/endoribonuclease ire-1 [Anopheles ziemanni]|uniref:serine/threonine-protein kinase/endoribonuclease ire-1 n=1 Tax=Anopheles coustani TaxID=139045 RepID=UPI00265A2754|nr:serine/threonine-protein kinase/endoribonuclease ire-1 [Anopheles coustani]XP_058171909.1 serine/threonine-protein kinase/endoribonuclease ire-1 [Anopheles ziemanni]
MLARRKILWVLLLLIGARSFTVDANASSSSLSHQQDCTAIAKDEETLLVFSTLGGGLTAIDPLTGETRWSIDDEPAIRVPTPSDMSAHYLPDPRDGSLYRMNGLEGGLKKLPYTIPQLVASAPCRSSDGILYSGKKSDVWFLVDPKTGRREKVLGFGGSPPAKEGPPDAGGTSDSIGWATSRAVYLGRTQYTVMMYDSQTSDRNSKPWNVTFFDYSAHSMAPELSKEYEFLHLTSSSSGMTATFEQKQGTPLWQKDLSSPVVAVFLLSSEGLLSVPFQTVSDDVLQEINERAKSGNFDDLKLFETVYIGEAGNNLYAIPSLVDKNTATIPSEPSINLLGGPSKARPALSKVDGRAQPDQVTSDGRELISKASRTRGKNENIIILGHYQTPKIDESIKLDITPSSPSSLGGGKGFWKHHELSTVLVGGGGLDPPDVGLPELNTNTIGVQTDENLEYGETNETKSQQVEENHTGLLWTFFGRIYSGTKQWLETQPNKLPTILLIMLFGLVIFGFWYIHLQMKALQEQSQSGSQTSNSNRSGAGTGSGGSGSGSYSEPIDFGDGEMRVGKINFNTQNVLGKGCEGTFVFRGMFEKREVAVKRILPGCFTLADREVALLRESDAHENVVRYFCTEQDRQFRYIAVELCAATVQDYVDGKGASTVAAASTVTVGMLRKKISSIDILRQATSGLMHLHSLSIVHRDIKPQNILLSLPDNRQRVRAMISDFGLCKKLNFGKASFSRRSGVTGTDGWIAPEMQRGQRATTSVDIFSLGCVFYYVLSDGFHPFGDNLKRQANILSDEYDLGMMRRENPQPDSRTVLAEELIGDMIQADSAKRPSARAVANHPLFWGNERVLAFLQDVSDRVEKLDVSSEPLRSLEKNARFVVRDDWSRHLDTEITTDLRKFRGYQGYSVRDLMRALRNKKHHYHELTPSMQRSLGSIPHEFTHYWLSRFPRLLSHSYHALAECSREPIFRHYYTHDDDEHTGSTSGAIVPVVSSGGYKFTKPSYFTRDDNDNYELLRYYEISQAMKNATKSPKRRMDGNGGAGGQEGSTPERKPTTTKRGTYNFSKPSGTFTTGGFITRQQMRENNDADGATTVLDAGGEVMKLPSDGDANPRRRYTAPPASVSDNAPTVTANQNNIIRRREAQAKVTWNLDSIVAQKEPKEIDDNVGPK